MTRAHLLILLGLLVILAPFSGLPSSWLDVVLPLLGLTTLLIGYTLRPAKRKESTTSQEVPVGA